ncbi:MAG: hypothetical protein ACLSVD_07430 [Eggerthellaceae bacterium]
MLPTCSPTSSARATWCARARQPSCRWRRPSGSNRAGRPRLHQDHRQRVDVPVIVDAGIGRPSQACEAMELGAAAVMANTAVATAARPPHGGRVQTRRGGGARGIPSRHGARARPRRASSPLTGFLAGLGGAMTQAGTARNALGGSRASTRLEAVDPADVARDRGIDPMAYLPDMGVTDSPVLDELLARAAAFDSTRRPRPTCAPRSRPTAFGASALLSSAAEPLLEELAAAARRARRLVRQHGVPVHAAVPGELLRQPLRVLRLQPRQRHLPRPSRPRGHRRRARSHRGDGARGDPAAHGRRPRAPTPSTSARRASLPPSASAWWAWRCTP